MKDKEILELINKESKREQTTIELIASENFTSKDVMEAQGSILTNKYAEGYPSKRYYGGCFVVDEIEKVAIERLKKLYNAKFANVQPHSGTQANMAAYKSLLKPNDTVLGMDLSAGGHLSHGYKLNFSGESYNFYSYGVNKDTELIDYEEVQRMVLEIKPRLIVAGASSYSRIIDFKRFREIADSVNAYLMVDMAHIAGLVAAGLHPSPLPYADIVTSTTHKTLRGPRGGIILTNSEEIAKKINSAVFPGVQGGPLMHVIAAKAIAFKEAASDEFVSYQKQLLKNCKAMADEFKKLGYRLVSGGTDNHLFMVDVLNSIGITGKKAEETLEKVNITCNKNAIPFDKEKPTVTSGIRIGTAAITSRGLKEKECIEIVHMIDEAFKNQDKETIANIKGKAIKLMETFPLNY